VRTDVGFDLDMTLVDSAAAIVDAVRFTCARFGVNADETAVRAGLGLPLDQVFPEWISDVPYDEALVIYRERYLDVGIDLTRALPGADAALASVRASGGSVLVVSAKHSTHVSASLAAVGLVADHVVGERFGSAKGEALAQFGAAVYVGDHPGDVAGALAAGAVAVGVPTGPTSAEDLRAAGAHVVLQTLEEFPAWNAMRLATP
jgi:phosphoglycolate phosphatase-like HAD superfamily hydrolase